MKYWFASLLFSIVSFQNSVHGYSRGAPTCVKAPNHGANTVMSRRKPHSIEFPDGQKCYNLGEKIRVKIAGPRFNGFVLYVDNAFGSSLSGEKGNEYQIWQSRRCVGATHTHSRHKRSLEFIWDAPTSENSGMARFGLTTFVLTGGYQGGDLHRFYFSLPRCQSLLSGISSPGLASSPGIGSSPGSGSSPGFGSRPGSSNRDARPRSRSDGSNLKLAPAPIPSGLSSFGGVRICPSKDVWDEWCPRQPLSKCTSDNIKKNCAMTCCLLEVKNGVKGKDRVTVPPDPTTTTTTTEKPTPPPPTGPPPRYCDAVDKYADWCRRHLDCRREDHKDKWCKASCCQLGQN